MSDITRTQNADAMLRAASRISEDARANYSRRRDATMRAMLMRDAKDMRHIASLIRKGKVAEAARTAQHMDTAARDEIPEGVWNYLMVAAGEWA